jgi:hypothetical protein
VALAFAVSLATVGAGLAWPSVAGAADETDPGSTPLEDMAPQILERVEDIRGLAAIRQVPVRTVAPEASAREHLAAITTEDLEELRADETLLTRVGLLPRGFDLLQAVEDLAAEGVAGYYRPEQGDIAIVDSDGSLDAYAPWTVAHEYVHALQDQHFDIEATVDAYPIGDGQAAVTALAEGDATLLMTALAMSDAVSGVPAPVPAEQAGIGEPTDFADLPPMLARELLFPYLDGMNFVQRMWGRGGWENVDAVWRDPPRSTEQIMHPQRYPDELPVVVELPDVASRLGEGWSTGPASTMGELRLSILVAGNEAHALPVLPLAGVQLPNAEAADGWGGDRIVTVDGPQGAWAVVWQTTWDTAQDAVEFAAAARDAMPGWASQHSVLEGVSIAPGVPADQAVLLLVADESGTLQQVKDALLAP